MFEMFLYRLVQWLNGGNVRIPSGMVLPPDEDETYNPGERR